MNETKVAVRRKGESGDKQEKCTEDGERGGRATLITEEGHCEWVMHGWRCAMRGWRGILLVSKTAGMGPERARRGGNPPWLGNKEMR